MGFLSDIECLLEELAGLEVQHPTRRNRDRITALRVAPLSGYFVVQDEVTKPGNLDFLTPAQGLFHGLKHQLHQVGGLFLREASKRGVNCVNNVRFCHASRPGSQSSNILEVAYRRSVKSP